jgi:hypothetical protein
MPRTPDFFPGDREEEGLLFLSGSEYPSKNGEVRYVAGVGFQFYEEGTLRTLSSSLGISSNDHQSLRQLIHFIDDGPTIGFPDGTFKETLPLGNPFPTLEIWWESAVKLKKIVQLEVTRSLGQLPVIEKWKMFDSNGSTVIEQVTDTITYSGVIETFRSRSLA